MSNTKKTTFKISELPQISTIDNHDLLLISDFDAVGKNGTTKKMQVQQITKFVTDKTKPVISAVVNQVLSAILPDAIDDAIQHVLSGDIQELVNEAVNNALSGDDFDTAVKYSLDRISDGKQDDTILVNGGTADQGGPVKMMMF